MSSYRNAKKNCGFLAEETELSSKYTGPFFVQESKSANQIAIENLRNKLKSIQWHKLANEASLQASLIRRKQARSSAIQAKERIEQGRMKSLDQASQKRRRSIRRNSNPAMKEEPRTSSRSEDVFESTKYKDQRNDTQSNNKEKEREMMWKYEEQRGDKQKKLNITRGLEKDHARLHSISKAGVSCFKHCASSKDLCNDSQKGLTREAPEEARCLKEASLPTVLTTVNKVISLEERIRRLSENQTELAKGWLFSSCDHSLERTDSNQPPLPKSVDDLDKGSSSHLTPRESASNDDCKKEDGLKQNSTLRNKDGRRVVITSSTKSSGYRAASYNHLKIPNNVPSQKRMKIIDKGEQKRRSSC